MHRSHFIPLLLALLSTAACSPAASSNLAPAGSGSEANAPQAGTAPELIGPPGSGTCVPGAPTTFANAVCVCEGLAMAGALRTHAPPGGSASVGVDGDSSAATGSQIEGSYVPYEGLSVAGLLGVRDAVITTGDLSGAGRLTVGHDLSVGGHLVFAGQLQVGGAIRSASPVVASPGPTPTTTAPYVAPAGPPCGCDPATLLPVAKSVAAAALHNDNAAHGLGTDAADLVGQGTLHLTTGTYYFKNVDRVGAGHITIDGAVSLYFDGDLVSVGDHQIELLGGASLDLYVGGRMVTAGRVDVGDPNHPERFRLFVGGGGSTMVTAGEQSYAGLVYAPQADVVFAGATTVDGSLFARSLTWAGALDVTYAGSAPSQSTCPPPPTTPPGAAPPSGSTQ